MNQESVIHIKCLLVDDDEDFRDLVKALLGKHANYHFVFEDVDNVQDAVVAVGNFQPDCSLVDYSLPGQYGIELIDQLKDENGELTTAIVMVTGQGSESLAVETMKEGAVDYLNKSNINANSLLRCVLNGIATFSLRRSVNQKIVDLQEFSSRVAHDIKSPVGFIYSACQVLKELVEGDAREMSEKIGETAQRALQIIDAIYLLSGLSTAKPEFGFQPLSDIVGEAKSALTLPIEESGCEIVVDCPHEVYCARDLLPQVFQNLMSNSIKFTRQLRKPVIRIRSEEKGGSLDIRFEDNGPGIPAEHRLRIFKAFERLHGSEVEGLGIGLNIANRVIDLHKGSIGLVESGRLGGATFRIQLRSR